MNSINRPITYGLVGCGFIAKQHIKAANDNNFQIKFISDIDTNKMNDFSLANNLEKVDRINDLSDYIKHNPVDFISIATDSGSHFRIASEIISNKTNLLVEKPLSLSTKDIKDLILLEKAFDVKSGVIFPIRFYPSVQRTKFILSNGLLGKVFSIQLNILLNRNIDYFKQANWRGTWKKDGGGVLVNQAIHHIDVLTYLVDFDPIYVYSKLYNFNHSYIEVEDHADILIEFDNKIVANVHASTSVYSTNFDESLLILCEFGTIKLSGKGLSQLEIISSKEKIDLNNLPLFFPLKFENHHSNIFNLFSQYLINKDFSFPINFSHSLKLMTLIYSAYHSNLVQEKIKYDLANDFSNMQFINSIRV